MKIGNPGGLTDTLGQDPICDYFLLRNSELPTQKSFSGSSVSEIMKVEKIKLYSMSLKIIIFATENITTFPEKELHTGSKSCRCNYGERDVRVIQILISYLWDFAIKSQIT